MSEYTIEGDDSMRWDVIAAPPAELERDVKEPCTCPTCYTPPAELETIRDHNAEGHDWETCPVCLEQAVNDEILEDARGPIPTVDDRTLRD